MVRKPRNSNDLNSKFEKVVRELRAKYRGGVLHVNLRGESWSPRLWGVIRALGCIVWPHLRPPLMKGRAAIKGFWDVELYEGGPRSGISGARTLRGVGHGHRMITILIHIHVRST